MKESVIQINGGIIIDVYVSVKGFMEEIMFGIRLHVIVEMENI